MTTEHTFFLTLVQFFFSTDDHKIESWLSGKHLFQRDDDLDPFTSRRAIGQHSLYMGFHGTTDHPNRIDTVEFVCQHWLAIIHRRYDRRCSNHSTANLFGFSGFDKGMAIGSCLSQWRMQHIFFLAELVRNGVLKQIAEKKGKENRCPERLV